MTRARKTRAPDIAAPPEIEVKLLAPSARELRAIARLTRLGPYRLRTRDTAHLHSVYVDTADMTLARHRVALRLRRDGDRWEATAKWPGRVRGDVHERPELTVRLRGAPQLPLRLPTGRLRRQLAGLVAGGPLHPILVTDIKRQRIDALLPDASEPVAEVALDRVQLRGPGRRAAQARYCEVEIEQLHGTRRDLTTLARLLRRAFDLAPSRESKFARGLKMLYGSDVPATRYSALDSSCISARAGWSGQGVVGSWPV